MKLGLVDDALSGHGLYVSGVAKHEDGAVVLISPNPDFWTLFQQSPEAADGLPDPIDRWSRRVIAQMAAEFGAEAVFPFDGPPYAPFFDWALASGRAWASPVSLLVHDTDGLFVSYRGGLIFAEGVSGRSEPSDRPCDDCAAPCLTACPVGALTAAGYDVPACASYLDGQGAQSCMASGCQVRRSCPVGAGRRGAAQSAFHMAAFRANLSRK